MSTNLKNIIIQAGGKGSRLGTLTFNKPKSIVAVNNLPIIFHLFKKYPDSKFIIIGDYKYEVLKRYLHSFAKNYNYELVKSVGTGNVCGIKQALDYINDDEKFMLIWSDLILSDDFSIDNLTNDNYIGILEDSVCSWSFVNGKLEKTPSDGNGVAGLFIFRDKQDFSTLPETGSFTTWLRESGIILSPLMLKNCIEVGTLDAIKKLNAADNRCRPYNKMEFTDDKVIKTGLTEEGKKLIDREIVWYEKMVEYGFTSIPKIYKLNPLTMEKIIGTNIFQANLNAKQKEETLSNLIKSVKQMHNFETIPSDKDDLKTEYYTKTIDRLESIRDSIPFSDAEYIIINGKKCKNILFFKDSYQNAVEEKLCYTKFVPIHGDCTLTNTLVDENNQIYFIDARGYFGSKKIFGDIRYDWAKLYYSINGNFDQFNVKNFDFNILEDRITYKIYSNEWEELTEKLLGAANCDVDEIKFIHSIIWLSLASHCWEDYDSMCLAFYNGTYLINEHI